MLVSSSFKIIIPSNMFETTNQIIWIGYRRQKYPSYPLYTHYSPTKYPIGWWWNHVFYPPVVLASIPIWLRSSPHFPWHLKPTARSVVSPMTFGDGSDASASTRASSEERNPARFGRWTSPSPRSWPCWKRWYVETIPRKIGGKKYGVIRNFGKLGEDWGYNLKIEFG